MQELYSLSPNGRAEEVADTPPAPGHLVAASIASLRRWKLIAVFALSALAATYGLLKLVPAVYKSTAEILVYDPQRQIDSAVQKPVSPFVDAIGYDAMATEINVLKSKSVALRVARELRLDRDPEFQPHSLVSEVLSWIWPSEPGRAAADHGQPTALADPEKLDQAADAFLARVDAWPSSYVISVSTTAESPTKAQLLTATIANDYLASQREARQEALERVANWLKGRVDNLRARVLETEASIETLKAENGIRDTEFNLVRQQQLRELNTALMAAGRQVNEKRSRLEQARRLVDSGGDIQSIPELTASATLTTLRQRQTELRSRAEELGSKLHDGHMLVIAARTALAAVNNQISAEATHILGNMKNVYEIAVQQEQSFNASLKGLTLNLSPDTEIKLQQLLRVSNADRGLYETYLSQYNDISERRTLQDASARIISPASLPRSPSSSRRKLFYGVGGMLGLGGGFLLAFLLEHRRPGVKTLLEAEQYFGYPVVGVIPLISPKRARRIPYGRLEGRLAEQSVSCLSEGLHAMRINLEITSSNPKIILITSALPAEGKSTTARLLAASSASSGKRTLLLDCDLHHSAESNGKECRPGLSEYLRNTAMLGEIITVDPVTKAHVISAGSRMPSAADWLMSQRMRDLVGVLRGKFDYIVMDAPPLLPVVDALVLSTMADKILVVVEWSHTPRASISDAFKAIRPEAHRVAGIVLTKVDLEKLPKYPYGGYPYRAVAGN